MGRKALEEVWEGSGGPSEGLECAPGGNGGIGRPTRRSRSGQEALAEVREASLRSGMGRDPLTEVWEESGVPCGGPGEVGWPSWRFLKGWEADAEVCEGIRRPSSRSRRG